MLVRRLIIGAALVSLISCSGKHSSPCTSQDQCGNGEACRDGVCEADDMIQTALLGDWFACNGPRGPTDCSVLGRYGTQIQADGTWVSLKSSTGADVNVTEPGELYCSLNTGKGGIYLVSDNRVVFMDARDGTSETWLVSFVEEDVLSDGAGGHLQRVSPSRLFGNCPDPTTPRDAALHVALLGDWFPCKGNSAGTDCSAIGNDGIELRADGSWVSLTSSGGTDSNMTEPGETYCTRDGGTYTISEDTVVFQPSSTKWKVASVVGDMFLESMASINYQRVFPSRLTGTCP